MSDVVDQPRQAQTDPPSVERPYLVLFTVLTAVFVQLVDVSIVNVAIPSIQSDIGASFAQVQLVLAGYQLAFACTLITAARLGDIYGRKRLFVVGMTLFTLASLTSGLAPEPVTLVLSRVVQGMASGLMYPQTLSVIQVLIPRQMRAKAFGILGATIGLATILGPLLGGLIIQLNLFGTDWRGIFLVNIPIGIAAVALALAQLPESRAPDKPRLDVPGAILVAAGLFLLVYPLTEGRQKGWPLWIYAMLVASVPLLVAFVVLQLRKTRRERNPLVLMTLFGNPSFRAGMVLNFVFFLGIPPFFFTISLYLQLGLGFTPLHSGLTTFPFAIGTAVASSQSAKIVGRIGNSTLLVGAATLAVSMVALIASIHLIGTDLHSYELAPQLFLAGVGLGLFVAPVINVILAGISGREAGSASGVLSTVQQIGGALGVALIGIVFFGLLSGHAQTSADDQRAALRSDLTAAGLPAAQVDRAGQQFDRCFVTRSQSADPSQTPPGCAPPADAPPAVTAAYARAGKGATGGNFLHAIERSLIFEVVVFGLAALLVPRLPRRDPDELAQGAPAAHAG